VLRVEHLQPGVVAVTISAKTCSDAPRHREQEVAAAATASPKVERGGPPASASDLCWR
jgi:hypothetical protein